MSVLLDGRFRFDNYVVGASNRLAVAAGRAVAEAPGATYNPLFIYSPSGLGKTHLIGAIGFAAKQLQPDLIVEYVPLDDFVDRLHIAISAGHGDAFKQLYQRVDLLLIDDVQFLTGKRETQSEMLRIFNALQGSGRQIIMASDRPPSEIADVDERLITRLAGGLIVDISLPEYETRVAILRNKCVERELTFANGVLEELAKMPCGSVRELQGALNRLAAHEALGERPVTPQNVRAIVGGGRSTPEFGRAPASVTDEFAGFISDIAVAVAQHVEGWRVRLGERIAHWQAAGYSTMMLDRVLALSEEVDVDELDAAFASGVARLEQLEAQAVLLDPRLAGLDVFRDPECIAEAEARIEQAIAAHDPPPAPWPSFTLETMIAGKSNQLALRAAEAVIEMPGARYNPLFVHGGTGVGKTHIVHAVGNALRRKANGSGPVACVSGSQFVDELIAALQGGTVDRWRARYRAAGALIVDDVHALAGKERSQDELFHLFNALHSAGRQVVLASDRPPSEIGELEARLRSRFDGGLVVAIQPPDRALREALYTRMLIDRAPGAEPGVAALLAELPVSGAAEVESVVERVVHAAGSYGGQVTLSLVRRELNAGGGATPTSVPAIADRSFLDAEKIVMEWPELDGRVIEELR
ncbi:MAG TPA: DnaA/Hda family protein [Gemmatimonadaceae bacterium]|nr:DnaA/Hda family protein [Gemmatimonadaceae bacterium]